MGRRSSQHHRLPRSRCAEFGLDPDDPRNTIVRDDKKHRAYHELLGNKTPEEAIKYLFLEWFSPISYFEPKFLKNEHLRNFFQQVWDERIIEGSVLSHFFCKKCGGRIIESQKLAQIKVFNCEQCGDFECFSCMICLKPGQIVVDKDPNLYLCNSCMTGFIKKKTRLPKRFKKYAHIIWKIWINSQ